MKNYFLKLGKKTLSVFLACLMIMTCWVFVAPEHNHAEAANALTTVNYTVKVTFNVTTKLTNGGNIYVEYYEIMDDGTLGTTLKHLDLSGSLSNDGMTAKKDGYSIEKECPGFPVNLVITVQAHWWNNPTLILTGFYIEGRNVLNGGTWSVKEQTRNWAQSQGGMDDVTYDWPNPTDVTNNTVIYPSGYSFYEDSYPFSNPTTYKLSKKYFTSIFWEEQGKQLYKKKKNVAQNGLCFGYTYTTAAIYNNFPSISNVYKKSDKTNISNLREVGNPDKYVLNIGNNNISVSDYIKYAFVYQYSKEYREDNRVLANPSKMISVIQDYAELNQLGVALFIVQYTDSTKETSTGAHEVLAIGTDGNDILIDDPNFRGQYNGYPDELRRLIVNDDGTWEYNGSWNNYPINNTNANLYFSFDTFKPYSILLTGNTVEVWDVYLDDETAGSVTESYILGMDKLSKDSLLLFADSNSYNIGSEKIVEVGPIISSSTDNTEEDNGTFYWVDDDKEIIISDIEGENNEFFVSGATTTIGIRTDDASTVILTMDEENQISAELDTEKGEEYTVFVESMDENEEDITTTITGIASGDTVTATETETGIAVVGFDSMTITYTDVDGSDKTEIKNADGEEVNVTVDEENNEISTDFECKHEDTDKNCTCDYCKVNLSHAYSKFVTAPTCTGKGYTTYTCKVCAYSYTGDGVNATGHSYGDDSVCDNCGADKSEDCTHLCHKSGFMGFIWKIVRIFCKLFKIIPKCSCGAAHY